MTTTETSGKTSRPKAVKALLLLLVVVAAVCLKAETETIDSYTWSYRVNGDEAEITNVSPKPTGSIAIPSMLGGRRVTSLGNHALYDCNGLASVMIPDSVTRIGNSAFEGCSVLASIMIPGSVTNIGVSAFYRCGGLISISVADNNVNFMSRNGLLLTKDGTTLVQGVNGNVIIPAGCAAACGRCACRPQSGKAYTRPEKLRSEA